MQFNLNELQGLSLEVIISRFISVPLTDNKIEFIDEDEPNKPKENLVAKALFYLPKHITAVEFKLKYSYKYHPADRDRFDSFDYHTPELHISEYIRKLPNSVISLILDFTSANEAETTLRAKGLEIPPSPDLSRDISNCFSLIQDSIKELYVIGQPLTHLSANDFFNTFISISANVKKFYALNSDIFTPHINGSILRGKFTHLSFAYTNFGNLAITTALNFVELAIFDTELFDLGFTNLDQKQTPDLLALFSKISTKNLLLAGNNLVSFGSINLREILTKTKCNELDLSENGLLFMALDDLKLALSGVKATKLRLCESDTTAISVEDIVAKFNLCLPSQINTLSFAACNLLGKTMAEFATIVHNLPSSITILDFSNNDFSAAQPEDLILLFSNIPSHTKKIILSNNNFCNMDKDILRRVLSVLPKDIEVELADNGFEGLPNTDLNELISALPDLTFNLGPKLCLKGNGKVVVYSESLQSLKLFQPKTIERSKLSKDIELKEVKYPVSGNEEKSIPYISLFKPATRLRHQNELANAQFALMYFLKKGILFDLFNKILPFIFSYPVTQSDINRIIEQLHRFETILPAKELPDEKRTLEEAEKAVNYRIAKLKPNDTCLDLSHCALIRLPVNSFKEIYGRSEKNLVSLNLKGNGFLQSDRTRRKFIESLRFIGEFFIQVDFSNNGLEKLSAKELKVLLANLPKKVRLISIANERPISPEDQIARLNTPDSYKKLTKNTPSLLGKAHILLKDYTKDSAFERAYTFHWNRHYVEIVLKLDTLIKEGKITNLQDLLAEIEVIKLENEAGSLGKRTMFLSTL